QDVWARTELICKYDLALVVRNLRDHLCRYFACQAERPGQIVNAPKGLGQRHGLVISDGACAEKSCQWPKPVPQPVVCVHTVQEFSDFSFSCGAEHSKLSFLCQRSYSRIIMGLLDELWRSGCI